jgi:hypothetical protein
MSYQLLQFDRRVVGVDDPRLEHHAYHQVVQWPQQVGTGAQPVTERGAVQEVALALVGPLHPVQRHVVGVLAHDQVGQQARPRQPLGNRHRRLGGCDHDLAGDQGPPRRHWCLGPLLLVRRWLPGASGLRLGVRLTRRGYRRCRRRRGV